MFELLWTVLFLFLLVVVLYLIISMRLYLLYKSEPNQRHTFHKYSTGFNILPLFRFFREPTY